AQRLLEVLRPTASGGFARRSSPGTQRRQSDGAGGEGDADEDQREGGERRQPEALVEEDRAVAERDRRHEVRDERRVVRSGPLDELEEEQVCDGGADEAEDQDRRDRLSVPHGRRRLDHPGRQRGERRDAGRGEGYDERRRTTEMPAGNQRPDCIAEG